MGFSLVERERGGGGGGREGERESRSKRVSGINVHVVNNCVLSFLCRLGKIRAPTDISTSSVCVVFFAAFSF